MPISPNFTSILEQQQEITFLHCYPNGYLKYTDLCNLLQLTAGRHADLGGISFTDMQAFHQAWVMSRMRLEIKKLPKWRDIVTVKTWVKTLENSRSVRCLEMYLNDEKIVGCETFWAVINTKTRRPEALALPHDHFQKFEIDASLAYTKKIDISTNVTTLANRKVVLSDLDVVNHVNNVKYMEWCLDFEDPTRLLNQEIATLDINFIKELNWNDVAVIQKEINTNTSIYSISKENKNAYALEINWYK
ncbi:MAG: acyl-[acyl-carrier-protein] thioesterase [Flavobacterium sp.]|uniref:acyl-[acyl-carrier-protein] thioesterase n=1 Tax=Flavobacterium sp. TaxID=239 RepID=UPI000C51A241|nr:acyl-ACP thioesterase domain-containing protein [Flavobacterium sp.]MBF02836.1 acyl-[acyl-carrier-protein] thioesterase [Flavobacterium sp.]|tara:strand:+ start:179 stop:919 length:741 start_codon:yes stop_codon:yes gene_type:complete